MSTARVAELFANIRSTIVSFFSVAMFVALGVGLFLGLSDRNFIGVAKIVLAAHVPVALIEGAVTAFMVSWFRRAAPDFLLEGR